MGIASASLTRMARPRHTLGTNMKKALRYGLLCFACCGAIGTAAAQDVTESRAIGAGIVRIKLDGLVDLRLRQGPQPSLTLSGDARRLLNTGTLQSGDILHIKAEGRGTHLARAPVRAELVLPALRALSSEAVGSVEVSGFAGDDLALSMEGGGTMKVACDYQRVSAGLGGVGGIALSLGASERVELDLRGAGYITLAGRGGVLKATLGGVGSIDAQRFRAREVELDLKGVGKAAVTAAASATLNLAGVGVVSVYGQPPLRQVSAGGLARVSWK